MFELTMRFFLTTEFQCTYYFSVSPFNLCVWASQSVLVCILVVSLNCKYLVTEKTNYNLNTYVYASPLGRIFKKVKVQKNEFT